MPRNRMTVNLKECQRMPFSVSYQRYIIRDEWAGFLQLILKKKVQLYLFSKPLLFLSLPKSFKCTISHQDEFVVDLEYCAYSVNDSLNFDYDRMKYIYED